MALISNINLYIDKESIGELINSYIKDFSKELSTGGLKGVLKRAF